MEIDRVFESPTSDQAVPPLIEFIAAKNVDEFDNTVPFRPSRFPPLEVETETPPMSHQREHSVSISMPSSPFMSNTGKVSENGILVSPNDGSEPKQVKFHSQPMLKGAQPTVRSASANVNQHPSVRRLTKDTRFNSFKTWSGKLEHQFSTLRGRAQGHGSEESNAINPGNEPMPCVERYFAALEGPELETLRPSETSILPDDKKWPFLLRYPVSTFGIILGVSSQAMLYKSLATSASTQFLHISPDVNLVLWWIAVALMVIVSSIYLLKVILYFEAVRREYYHPIRVNFFFAPWIALLFLAIGVPPSVTTSLPHWLWYALMTPIFCLELKIYGQWMSGGQRRLSRVANPSNHLSVVGNFVGALLGASMGLKEGPLFFFAVGLAHYTVLFVTLYQRLPTNETLPKELHPVFFLFVAAPSVASMAWAKLNDSFDYGSRIAYFITMFLYLSLAVRVNFFRGFQFSLAWWAYTFPMTGAAIATIRYSLEVTNTVTRTLAVALSVICTLIVTALLVSTILHAFVFRDLFPNDIAIAISDKRPHKPNHRKWFHKNGSVDHSNDIENYLKFSNAKDLETAAVKIPTSSNAD